MSLSGSVSIQFSAVKESVTTGGKTDEVKVTRQFDWTITNGEGAGAAEKVAEIVVQPGGTPVDVALSPSTLKDASGNAITFTAIKAIKFMTPSTNTGNVVVGADATNPWDTLINATGTLTIPPDSAVAAACKSAGGWGVSASDVIEVSASGTDQLIIVVVGEAP